MQLSLLSFAPPVSVSPLPQLRLQVFPFQKDAVTFAAWCNACAPEALRQLQQQAGKINFEVGGCMGKGRVVATCVE